jgi:hypothetical protein
MPKGKRLQQLVAQGKVQQKEQTRELIVPSLDKL